MKKEREIMRIGKEWQLYCENKIHGVDDDDDDVK